MCKGWWVVSHVWHCSQGLLNMLQCFSTMLMQARWQQLHTFLRQQAALDPLARASTMALQQRCITRLSTLANSAPVRDQRCAQHPAMLNTLQDLQHSGCLPCIEASASR